MDEIAYQEQRIGVKWQAGGVETQSIQPTLGVLERLGDVPPGEAFIMGGIAVGCQSGQDEVPFLARDESGSVRVVLDEPVRTNGHDNRRQPFQNKDPVPAIIPNNSHMTDALHDAAVSSSPHCIQAFPGWLLTYARIPPKAPASAAPLKNRDMRYCRSFLLYHMEK